jgi:NAD(P)-dependent dehydrogenase (short-subunit alcohol dehydrogenase family)
LKVKYSDLKNKRVFITGGGSGIGASIVEHFCEQGSEVYFVDINIKETNRLLKKIKKNKFRMPNFIECNLLDINKLEKIIKKLFQPKDPFML